MLIIRAMSLVMYIGNVKRCVYMMTVGNMVGLLSVHATRPGDNSHIYCNGCSVPI